MFFLTFIYILLSIREAIGMIKDFIDGDRYAYF